MKKNILMVVAIFLSSCASVNLKDFDQAGSKFTDVLAKNYADLSKYEADAYDWSDSEHYAIKAKKALKGEKVEPENLADWKIDAKYMPELERARAGLVAILNEKNIEKNAKILANAQSSFDCWVEEREENWQYENINQCKKAFYDAHNSIATKKLKPEFFAEGNRHSIYFDTASAIVCPCKTSMIGQIFKYAQDINIQKIEIHGHADSTGGDAINEKISLARAEAVRDFFVSNGFKGEIEIFAHGNKELAVKTPKGVKNAQNRRVEIIFIQ